MTVDSLERELAAARAERDQADARETAFAEVLQAINASSGDPKPAFDLIIAKAMALCDAAFGALLGYDGERLSLFAHRNSPTALIDFWRTPQVAPPESGTARVLVDGKASQILDLAETDSYRKFRLPMTVASVELGGIRTLVQVPLSSERGVIGLFILYRLEVKPFTDEQIALVESFASQATLAMENARLLTEQREALEQQTATAEILQVISRSPTDVGPVLDAVVKAATRFCGAPDALVVLRQQGDQVGVAAHEGPLTSTLGRLYPADRSTVMGRTVVDGMMLHIPDINQVDDPGLAGARELAATHGWRAVLSAPMLRDGVAVGGIGLRKPEAGPFTHRQIELLETFAAQAVIAIENVRLFTELKEALEQQTATAEVLEVINASPGNLEPVLGAMLEKAMHLCEAAFGIFGRFDGKLFEPAVDRGVPAELIAATQQIQSPPPNSGLGRIAAGASVVQLVDLANTDLYRSGFIGATALVDIGGAKTAIFVALRKDGVLLGVIVMYRREVRAFSDKQVALLQNFAAQAVIAMENARLITEQREALEQQTATADILRVISQSPTDVGPVLEAVATAALRFCGAEDVVVLLREGAQWLMAGHEGPMVAEVGTRQALSRQTAPGRAILDGVTTHFPDIGALDPVEFAAAHEFAQRHGFRSALAAPMLREGAPIGAIALRRSEAGAFTERQIELLESFAAQAVIAIENVRLFAELSEALEQQTATTDILQTINGAPGDVQPVFDAIVEKAMTLCDAAFGMFNTFDGERFHTVATRGIPEAYAQFRAASPPDYGPGSAPARLIAGEDCVHEADMADHDLYRSGDANRRSIVDLGGARTILNIALRKEGRLLGMIAIYRREVRPFTDKQIALLQGFAGQAVIAMDNARLLTELRESLEYQTATSDVLSVISRSTSELEPVLNSMLAAATRLCAVQMGGVAVRRGDVLRYLTSTGVSAEFDKWLRETPHPIDRTSVAGRAAADKRIAYIPDVAADRDYAMPHTTTVGNMQSLLGVPLLREGEAVGVIVLGRSDREPFTERQIALVRTFADQAVIAMENTRLLADLRESLDYQTAMSEVLEVISRSTSDLAPVLNTMLAAAAHLCGVKRGDVSIRRDGQMRYAASIGTSEAEDTWLRSRIIAPDRSTCAGRAMVTRQVVHVLDQSADPELAVPRQISANQTVLSVPLLREDEAIGVITVLRDHVEAFSERQIALIKTFADQAVIAIENARLLGELRERTNDLTESLEYQTATSDLLEVISRSASDIQPVLDRMLNSAARLCGVAKGDVAIRQGEVFRHVAFIGTATPEEDTWLRARITTPGRGTSTARALLEKQVNHVLDQSRDPERVAPAAATAARTTLAVPLLREGEAIGVISLLREHVEPFSERQIALVKTFADQAVIAMENARLLSELRESLDQQTATAEILQVINGSPGNPRPVYDEIVVKAMTLCDAAFGMFSTFDGVRFHAVSTRGVPEPYAQFRRLSPPDYGPGTVPARVIAGEDCVEVADMADSDLYRKGDPNRLAIVDLGGARTVLNVALRREGTLLGMITLYRQEVRTFSEKQIALVQGFAGQAVVAMENARLLSELRESLDQQTAMAEVLGLINSSTGDITPVFDAMVDKATALCDSPFGVLFSFDGQALRGVSTRRSPQDREGFLLGPIPVSGLGNIGRALREGKALQDPDLSRSDAYRRRVRLTVFSVEQIGIRTVLFVPLMSERGPVGLFGLYRTEVRPFTDQQIALVEAFAQQAVVAMENARLLGELTRREEELRVTFDHMGDGVVMFDADLKLASWNRNFQELLDIPDSFLAGRPALEDYVSLLVQRGEVGRDNPSEEVARYRERTSTPWSVERTRPDGRILEVRNNPVPGGGAVLIYSDITKRKKAEVDIRSARDAAEAALVQLKAAQANLVQSEKMASLGQLTAGIAHEIKNPLNFVNNFASLSVELLDELKDIAGPALETLDEDKRAELDETMGLLTGNLGKIAEHGKRADGIVKSMLSHSRGGSGDWQASDINTLVEEALNLAYHGARAQDKEFNVTLERDFDKAGKPIEVVPQDVMRVFLNLFGNGFYAANKRRLGAKEAGFRPTIKVSTRELGDGVEVRVRDNGIGIPAEVRAKLFQPFFTTKPTGEGTGLGLSISYDIVTQQHGGTVEVESEVGKFTEFTVRLPRSPRITSAKRV